MSAPQTNSFCKNGVAEVFQYQATWTDDKGNKRTTKAEVTICNGESRVINNESSAVENKNLKNLLRKPKTKSVKAEGGEVNHGMLSLAERSKALDHGLREHPVEGPQGGTAKVRMLKPSELGPRPSRAPGSPTRAAGTPKK